jgi:hypothetical protein
VRLERGDAAAQRLTGDLDAVGRAEAGELGDDEPAHGVRLEILVVDLVEAIGRVDLVAGAEYDVRLDRRISRQMSRRRSRP